MRNLRIILVLMQRLINRELIACNSKCTNLPCLYLVPSFDKMLYNVKNGVSRDRHMDLNIQNPITIDGVLSYSTYIMPGHPRRLENANSVSNKLVNLLKVHYASR